MAETVAGARVDDDLTIWVGGEGSANRFDNLGWCDGVGSTDVVSDRAVDSRNEVERALHA